jgi:hypothetical protein
MSQRQQRTTNTLRHSQRSISKRRAVQMEEEEEINIPDAIKLEKDRKFYKPLFFTFFKIIFYSQEFISKKKSDPV